MAKEKLSRNLKICEMVYEDQRPTEVAKHFGIHKSRVSHIVERYWKAYLVKRNEK